VVATGGLEQPLLFGNSDLPGVMLAGAVERLIRLYRVRPGSTAVVLTGDDRGYATAHTLTKAGARVTVLDWRDESSGPEVDAATKAGANVRNGFVPLRAEGGKRLRALVARAAGSEQRFDCDLVVMSGQLVPASGLLAQAGTTMRYDEAAMAFVPDRIPDGIQATGAVTGSSYADVSIPDAPKTSAKTFACVCMDVTTKEMEISVEEGFDSIELLKRYTTLGMGPCQGKSCLAACVRYAAKLTSRSIPETGVPTARAPWRPVELGLLAADHLEPRKESPLHECHADLGAEFMWAGE
jgi:sarcosine oxidase subunit alpha